MPVTNQPLLAIAAHPDRDGVLSSALAVRLKGRAAEYQKANAHKLVDCLKCLRDRLHGRAAWPVNELLVIDVAADGSPALYAELSKWKAANTAVWFMDHHAWPEGAFDRVKPLLADNHPLMAQGRETEGAAGRICVRTFSGGAAPDEHTRFLLDMIYKPRQMDEHPYAKEWYPVIDGAKRISKAWPAGAGYAAFGQIIEALAEGAEVPPNLLPIQQDEIARRQRTEAFMARLQLDPKSNRHGVRACIIDLQSHGDLSPTQIMLSLAARRTDAHFCLLLLGRQIKASLFPEGRALGLDLRVAVTMDGRTYCLCGHEYAASTPELGQWINIRQLADLFADAIQPQ